MELSDFHFLRPAWLLAVLSAIWLWWRLLRRRHPLGVWARVMEARFARLFISEQTPPQRWPIHALLALWIAAAVALAGPTWSQKPVPAHKLRTGTLIVLDLSLSMLARDIPPSRLQRARFKVEDLVRRNPQHRFGLIAYAGTAHTITPLAEDSATLLNLLPSLNPLIMPEPGSRPDLAMELAHRLFTGARVKKGHIIWITDDLDRAEALRRFFKQHDYTLAILAVGTPEGAPVPLPDGGMLKDHEGHTIIARLPWKRLEAFARELGATLTPLTLDDADLRHLQPPFTAATIDDAQHPVAQWQDAGPFIVVLIALAGALAFRRGWIFVLLPMMLLPQPQPVQAQEKTLSDWRDIFRTPDQQGYVQWRQKHYGRACDLFENPRWKALACEKAGRRQEAMRALNQIEDKSAIDWYNLGTLHARAHQWNKAESALKQALRLRPDFQQAKDNLDWVINHRPKMRKPPQTGNQTTKPANLPQQAVQNAKQPVQKEPSTSENGQKPQKSAQKPPKSDKNAQAERAKKSDLRNFGGTPSHNGNHSKGNTAAPPTGKPDLAITRPARSDDKAPAAGRRESAVPDNWLQLIPDEPGLFLQRKFEYQSQQQPRRRKEDKTW